MKFLFCISILAALGMLVNCVELAAPSIDEDEDCSTVIYDLIDCMPYMSLDSDVKLDPLCCEGLKIVFAINSKCICEGLKASSQFGILVNMTRAILLPSACGVDVPFTDNCDLALPPAGEPVGLPDSSSPRPAPSEEIPPSEETPTSPSPSDVDVVAPTPTPTSLPTSPSDGDVVAPAPSNAGGNSICVPFIVIISLLVFYHLQCVSA